MPGARQRGAADYKEGVAFIACPFPARSDDAAEWRAGWVRAQYERRTLRKYGLTEGGERGTE